MGGLQPWPQVAVGNEDHGRTTVVIIGAGISGMCMAINLIKQNKCHNFIIVEKSSGIGGTWRDNKYPGCCCDVWSTLYSYSFEQNPDWSREYPGQEEILEYLHNVAHKYKLYKYIRFNTSVQSATWSDPEVEWKIDVKVSGGKDAEFGERYTITSDFLVSAVGQLNQPRYPKIEGLEEFKGKVMHSARWDWSYHLTGKKVGIIGNGATAAQIIPEILPSSVNLVVYQRSPNWVIPRADGPVSPLRRTLYRYFPPLRWRTRALQMDYRESFYSAVTDTNSPAADLIRHQCTTMLQEQIPKNPEMWAKLTPDYSPGCKRVIITDDYYSAIADPKTTLETRPIQRITPTGIEVTDANGKTSHHDHDMLILATGFQTTSFLSQIRITGTNNTSLSSLWEHGPRTLYGLSIPSTPNLTLLYGPNTNLGHNSIILMIESQCRYTSHLISSILNAKSRGQRIGIMPKEDRTREWDRETQNRLQGSSFADERCGSWYKDPTGRVTNNWAGTVVEYQQCLERVDWEDYEVVVSGDNGGKGVERREAREVVFGEGRKESWVGRVREETVVSNAGLVLGMVSAAVVVTAGWVFRGGWGGKRLGA